MLKARFIDASIVLFTMAGLAVCLVLWWIGAAHGTVAGCGAGGCNQVLGSRWASVFLLPVSWYGAFLYAVWLACELAGGRRHRVLFAGPAAGAAVWFVIVQAFVLKSFCPWCMSVHAVGLVLAVMVVMSGGRSSLVRLLQTSLVAGIGLGLAQVYGPVKPTHLMEAMEGNAPDGKDERRVRFDGGKISFSRDEYPRLGSPEARHVVVELFDYQCSSCRVMSGYVKALVDAYPGQVSVLLVPVPMERVCNQHVAKGGESSGSCAISRIALAVWAAQPEGYGGFHEALMSDPSEALARDLALAYLDPSQLDEAVKGGRFQPSLEAGIRAWKQLSGNSSSLPKLLISDRRVLHGLPASQESFLAIMKSELALD